MSLNRLATRVWVALFALWLALLSGAFARWMGEGWDFWMREPDGTVEAFQKYLEIDPSGPMAQTSKDMLASIGATVETGFGTTKKKPAKK